jgi:hypothetical protein
MATLTGGDPNDGGFTPIRTSLSSGLDLWTHIRAEIASHVDSVIGNGKPRMSTVTIPLVGLQDTPVGWVASLGVASNGRIVAYQIFSLVPGTLTVDIQRSDPVTHPSATFDPTPYQFPSLINDPALLPSINGAYADNFNTDPDPVTLWASRELVIGDMLHVYIVASDGQNRSTTMILYLQDLDERT